MTRIETLLAACALLVWAGARADIPSPVCDTAAVVCAEFVYDDADFPSCHAATIVETSRGEPMIALFGGLHENNSDCSIWITRRRGNGWQAPRLVADGMIDTVKTACWNPVLFQVPGGDLLLFYKVGACVQEWSGWLVRSSDGGDNWSKPERLPEGFLGPIKNKPLLAGDRLLCGSSLERGGWRTYLETTDRRLSSWRRIGPLNDRKSAVQIIQPSLVRHADGTLQAICRSVDLRGNIVSVFSHDGGETWDEPISSGLPNNDSGLDAVALKDGRILLVYNHVEAVRNGAAARSPINVALSDDGRVWYAALTLENSAGEEYSYPSVIQTGDGLVHIVYTWHRERIKHVVVDPARLRIDPARRITDEAWREAGRRTDRRVDSLVAGMTLDEKLDCFAGRWVPHDRGTHDLFGGTVPRAGMAGFRMEYAAQGVHTNGKSTLYPSPLALAAAFDLPTVARVAGSIAADCRARGIAAALAPELSLYDERFGELRSGTFGSGPEYAAQSAAAFAEGLSGGGIVPIGRYRAVGGDRTAGRRMLRRALETGLFAGVALRGEADGVRATEDSVMNLGFLRGECRFDGLLIADLWQTCDSLADFRGGIDLDLPRGQNLRSATLRPAVEAGRIPQAEVDARVAGILSTVFRFGLVASRSADFSIPANRAASREVSLDAARKSLVLLKNERKLLPLKGRGGRILVLGNRVRRNSESRDLTSVYPFGRVTLADALAGEEEFELLPEARERINLAATGCFFSDDECREPGLKAEYFDDVRPEGTPRAVRCERFVDHAWAALPSEADTVRFSVRWSGVYRPDRSGIVRFGCAGRGRGRLLIDGREVGRIDPAEPDREAVHLFRIAAGRTYRIEVEFAAAEPEADIRLTCAATGIDDLDELLRQASRIVLSVGSDGDADEEVRFWIDLIRPYGRKTAIVMQSCDLRDMTWCDAAGSVVMAWHAGEAAGQAVADLLTGRTAPTGRMPVATDRYPFGYGLHYR